MRKNLPRREIAQRAAVLGRDLLRVFENLLHGVETERPPTSGPTGVNRLKCS
jgi:hypothetical protein